MKICILAEGSYPHVLGGVSSWINILINSCPEHEFIIYSIGADSSKRGKYKYEIPANVSLIKEVFLDEMDLVEGVKGKSYAMSSVYRAALKNLLMGESLDWKAIFKFFKDNKFLNMTEFFMSKNFFDIVKETYIEKYPHTPFTEFLWTIRSMYTTLFYLLTKDIPQADLYHSVSTGYAGIIGAYCSYLTGKKYILSEHGIYTREREEEIIKSDWVKGYHKELWINFFINLSRGAYKYSSTVTTLFENNKQLQIELGCDENKIQIISNGIDVKLYENIALKEEDSVINIGAIVRVVPIKDIKTMILSFQLVKEQIPNANIYIMGPVDEDEEYFNECKNIIDNLDTKGVTFTGTVKVVDYIGKMDILLLTSISEGQPLAIMEGMAAKKPQVCTNVGHCKGLLYGDSDMFGKAGIITSVMDYNEIAEAVIKLCKDKKLREQMGNNGYKRALALYKKEKVVDSFKNLYMKK